MTNDLAEKFLKKIKHFLISNFGKVEEQASPEEFYQAFAHAIRDEIMIYWTATEQTYLKYHPRIVYFLSMEYLVGKLLTKNITYLNSWDLVQAVLKKTNRTLSELVSFDVDPGLGNGGLGRLAACFLDSLATHNYPAMAYGLRYQYGIFDQEIWRGEQVERPDCWLLNVFPWEVRKDSLARNVHFGGKVISATNRFGDELYHLENFEEVRALPYDIPFLGYGKDGYQSVHTLRLWSTKESPRNFELQHYNAGQLGPAAENTSLSDVLYPNDNHEIGKRIRLKQEFLLVSASLQDIIARHLHVYENIMNLQEKVQIQINDTHAAMIIAELPRFLITHHDLPFSKAWEITQECCNYTNHTILREALEEWNEKRVALILPRQYQMIVKLNEFFFSSFRQKIKDEDKIQKMALIENGQIKMAHLAIFGSKKVNGVARLHGKILQTTIFKDFHELYPDKFTYVTNGVTQRRWLMNCNYRLSQFIGKRIGIEWIHDFSKILELKKWADDQESQKEFLEIKKLCKVDLFDFLYKENPIRDQKGQIIGHMKEFDPTALLDVQVKRFHEYKRQLMLALHLLMLADDYENHPEERTIKRMVLVGGKSAPGYEMAKMIISLISAIAERINFHPKISQNLRVALVENYNVSKAELIIPATDLSEQISCAGMEASGTGNMKFSMNGALTIGTEDGANIEMKESVGPERWPFSFGYSAEDVKNRKGPSPLDIYNSNEKIKRALDLLKDGSLGRTMQEKRHFSIIYDSLLQGWDYLQPDQFYIVRDLESYYLMQKKVEHLFMSPEWPCYALHNIAGMGPFSSDYSIQNYQKIWQLTPQPVDVEIFEKVSKDFGI